MPHSRPSTSAILGSAGGVVNRPSLRPCRMGCSPPADPRAYALRLPRAGPLKAWGDAIPGQVGGRPLVAPGAFGSHGANLAQRDTEQVVPFRTHSEFGSKSQNASGT